MNGTSNIILPVSVVGLMSNVCMFYTKITQPHQQKGELSIGHDGPQLLINRDEPMSIVREEW